MNTFLANIPVSSGENIWHFAGSNIVPPHSVYTTETEEEGDGFTVRRQEDSDVPKAVPSLTHSLPLPFPALLYAAIP